jgi:predicted PurR-regulated permease PerM
LDLSREDSQYTLFEIEESMGSYVRGIVFVALFVGMANFIILLLLGIPNAATFAFIIGLTTMLPVVGGFIGGISATLLGLLSSPLHGLAVFGTFVLVQQAEVHYLTPRVMARSIGVDPLLVMVAVFVGFAMYGVIGAVISIPILGTIAILLRDFVLKPYRENIAPYDVEQGKILFRPSEDPTPTPTKLEPVRSPQPASE